MKYPALFFTLSAVAIASAAALVRAQDFKAY
jgi:hypothetical protein